MQNQTIPFNAETTERAEDKLFNFRPFFFSAVFLCLGIVFAFFTQTKRLSWWWTACLALTATPLFFCKCKKHALKILLADLTLLASFFIGAGGFFIQTRAYANTKTYNGDYAVVGTVVEKTTADGYIYVVLTDLKMDGEKTKGKLVAYLPAAFSEKVALSDELLLTGEVQTQTELTDENGFRAYAIENGLRYQIYAENYVVLGTGKGLFLRIRARMEKVIYAGMDQTPAAVTIATLTGNVKGIEEGLLNNVRYGGIAHIFAVSGLHIGALYAFSLLLVQKTSLGKTPKIFRFLLLSAILLFYGGVCGFTSSVTRAIVMCLSLYAGSLVGFGTDATENIALAAIVVLLLSPVSLFAVGFQLSFAACLGIVWLAHPLARAMGKRKRRSPEKAAHPPTLAEEAKNKILDFLSVTISAQIATAPVQMLAFGYLSGWSLFLNCLFVPLISAAFSLLLLFVFFASILPLVASPVVLYLSNLLWSAALLLFQTTDFSSFALVGVNLSFGSLFCYYAACTFLTDKWNINKRLKVALFILCFIAFGLTVYALNA